jgi:hypothetical protein
MSDFKKSPGSCVNGHERDKHRSWENSKLSGRITFKLSWKINYSLKKKLKTEDVNAEEIHQIKRLRDELNMIIDEKLKKIKTHSNTISASIEETNSKISEVEEASNGFTAIVNQNNKLPDLNDINNLLNKSKWFNFNEKLGIPKNINQDSIGKMHEEFVNELIVGYEELFNNKYLEMAIDIPPNTFTLFRYTRLPYVYFVLKTPKENIPEEKAYLIELLYKSKYDRGYLSFDKWCIFKGNLFDPRYQKQLLQTKYKKLDVNSIKFKMKVSVYPEIIDDKKEDEVSRTKINIANLLSKFN